VASSNSLSSKQLQEKIEIAAAAAREATIGLPLPKQYNSILEEANKAVNGERQENYGSQSENFKHIAQMWAVILRRDVSVQEVAMCMMALKLARLIKTGGGHRDSIVDIAGYAECLAKVNAGL
jgi:hypothetical protein